MKKNSCKKYILSALLIFTTVFFAYATDTPSGSTTASTNSRGYEKCVQLSNLLSSLHVNHRKENIVFNESNIFPYNIIVTFPSNEQKKIEGNSTAELTIALKTEDFFDNSEIISRLCTKIKETPHVQKINLIFTYGDAFNYSMPSLKSGTEAYTQNLSDALSVNAVVINLAEKNRIIGGTKKSSSPTYLSKAAADAFQKNSMMFDIAGGLITFLYKMDFLKTDDRANLFSEAGSSCICVNFSSEEENLDKLPLFFEEFIKEYENPSVSVFDSHSNQIAFEGLSAFFSEKLTLLLFIISAGLSLFALSELSFLNRQTKERLTEDILKLWYLIPLSVFVTTISLFLSQAFSLFLYNVFSANIYIQVAIKLLSGFTLSTLVFLLFLKFQGILISNAYSYLVTISGIINLILFPSLDLSLFYLFAFEYILLYLSRPARHTGPLLFYFFMLFTPFIPYAVQLIKYSKPQALQILVRSPLYFNVFASVALLPFEIQWLRILVRLNAKWKKASKGTKKFHVQNIITFGAAFLIFLVISVFADYLIPEKYKNPGVLQKKTYVESGEASLVKVRIQDKRNYGEKTRILNIETPENTRSVHVQICGKKSNPVLYSDNDFIQDKGNYTDIFRLPLYPPENITLRYIAREDEETTIKIFCELICENEEHIKLIKKEISGK